MIAFKPSCYPDESPASFLTRMSDGIGHDNVIDMVRTNSAVKCYRNLSAVLSVPDRYIRLMESIGINDGYPSPVAENPGRGCQYRLFNGFKLKCTHLRGELAAFCPDCLRSQAYWRKRWSLKIYTVCETHGCELIDVCQKCNTFLSVERSSIHLCPECDFDLRKSKSPRVNNLTQRIVRGTFANDINPQKFELMLNIFTSVNDAFQESMSDTEKMDVTRLIMEVPSQAELKLQRILVESTCRAHPRIQLLPLLMNRKSAIIAEAAIRKCGSINLCKPKEWSGIRLKLYEASKVLNVSLDVIQKFIKCNILSVVGENSARRISGENLVNLLDKTSEELLALLDKASGNDARELRYVTGAQATELLGANETIVWGLVKANHLKKSVQIVGGYRRNTIEKASIDNFKSEFILPGVIAKKFGVPKQNITQRLRTLKIYPVSGPSINGAVTNVFKISDIQRLTKSTVQSAKVSSNKSIGAGRPKIRDRDYVTMKDAAVLLGVGMRSMTKLTREGILKRLDLPRRNVLIERKSIHKLMKRINDSNYVRLVDVRQSTEILANPFWHYFVNTGIIKVVQLFSWQLVHKRCVKKMNDLLSKYVTETEGNKILGKGSKGLTHLRMKGKIKFKEFPGKLHKVYFYSIESIETLRRAKFAED